MRKGFTMIELIFVIVILGILAAVAVPRLTATRDDAEIAKAATNLTTLISDISAFYTSQAEFAASIKAMTNVQVESTATKPLEGDLLAAGKKCLHIALVGADATTGKPAVLAVTKGSQSSESICEKIINNKGINDILESTFKYTKINSDKSTTPNTDSQKGEIAISGLGVKF